MQTVTHSTAQFRTCSDLRFGCFEESGFEIGIQHITTGEYLVLDRHASINDLRWHFAIKASGIDEALSVVKNPNKWLVLFFLVKPDGTRAEITDPRTFTEDADLT